MIYWTLFFALALGAALVLLLPLFRHAQAEAEVSALSDLKVFKDQLAELERDEARGMISAEDAKTVRAEIGRRILAADKRREAQLAALHGQSAGASRLPRVLGAALIAASVGGVGFATYHFLGAPGYSDQPRQARLALLEEAAKTRPSQAEAEAKASPVPQELLDALDPNYVTLVAQLREAVAARGNDVQGLRLLVQHEAAVYRFDAAARALTALIEADQAAATAENLVELGELMVMATRGYVSPEAENVFKNALSRDPRNQPARYYAGLAMAQTGRADLAYALWERLLRESDPEELWMPLIAERIEATAWVAGVTLPDDIALTVARLNGANAPFASMPGPDADALAASEDMSEEERTEMIRGMVGRLSERLAQEGGTAQEWARLIQAYGVLGETGRANAIYREALETFADRPAELDTIRNAARAAELIN